MKKVIAMKWAKALESGKYKQGKGELYLKGKYCCLGVLCELAPKSKITKRFRGKITGGTLISQPRVKKWAEMKYHNGTFTGGSLVNLNDNGMSFKGIAQLIRKEWKNL